ncbi:hypothetical protein [Allomesorhizobium camelthorni]|uniref:Uncharacterized protein n=1 Tax=Allomesorhizobium camelthorni TaxID=475069 RepID=A0A6G4WGY4_9HYPH|nr:hypothetical protein [Mesorhizobium camelthorni]NGO54052.1 hypothetical protein [Mesorhizobium camelthorni]
MAEKNLFYEDLIADSERIAYSPAIKNLVREICADKEFSNVLSEQDIELLVNGPGTTPKFDQVTPTAPRR